MPVVTSWLMEKFEAIGNVRSCFQVLRKKQDTRMMCSTVGRGGRSSDSETPRFFAFVGVDLEVRWKLNKGVCVCAAQEIGRIIKNKKQIFARATGTRASRTDL